MKDENGKIPAALGWRTLVVAVIAVVAGSGVALLLIPQLSMRAAVRGGSIALGAVLFGRIGTWWYVRSKRR